MVGKVLIPVVLTILFLSINSHASVVTFKSLSAGNGDNPVLRGILGKPEGAGPFPAVVMLHGSLGINSERDLQWANRLIKWGYVVLQVDSFQPRGLSHVVDDPDKISFAMRGMDALGAKDYLAGLEFVDSDRMALMGWSHGGSSVISAAKIPDENPYRVAIAFYPFCSISLSELNMPLLILMGEKDEWCPVAMCREQMPKKQTGQDLWLQIYPDAFHDFDWKGLDRVIQGRRMKYHQAAAEDAIQRVRLFLAMYLKCAVEMRKYTPHKSSALFRRP